MRQWVHVHGTHWSFHIPTNMKQLLEWPFEDLQHHIGGDTLLARNKVCQKAVYSLNQCPIYDIVSPIARIHGSMDQEVEIEVVPLTNPSIPLAKCLLPLPMNLCSAGLEVLFREAGMLTLGNLTMTH